MNNTSSSSKKTQQENKYQKTIDFLLENFEIATKFKTTHTLYQGLTIQEQLHRADKQYRREYTDDVARILRNKFYDGQKDPSRYYPLTNTRVDAFRGWKSDLIINNLESSFIVSSTPKPRIKTENEEELKDEIISQFFNMKIDELQNIPEIERLDALNDILKSNNLEIEIDKYMKKIENVKEIQISSLSNEKCEQIKKILADYIIEGDFRRQYIAAIHNQILYGVGFLRFPEYKYVKSLTEKNTLKYEIKPRFRSISPFNMFCSPDGTNLFDCSFIAEVNEFTKENFIEFIGTDNAIDEEIQKIIDIEETEHTTIDYFQQQNSRWIIEKFKNIQLKLNCANSNTNLSINSTKNTTIPVIIIECSAPTTAIDEELIPQKLKNNEYVDCEFIITENNIIYSNIVDISERTYYDIPFIKTENNVWGTIGIAARLYDTEYRINTLLHTLEMNMEYAVDPVTLVNDSLVTSQLKKKPKPGAMLHFSEEAKLTARDSKVFSTMYMSEPQYGTILNVISDLIRKADDESLIPSYAFSNGYTNSRTSLGEIKLKMDNAFRSVKEIFLQEDVCFLTPCLESMFRRIITQDSKKYKIDTDYLDLDLKIRGLIGILEEDSYKLKAEETFQKFAQLFGSGILDPIVEKYIINNYLKAYDIPLNALGVDDPILSNAISYSVNLFNQGRSANYHSNSQASLNAQVDGRSGEMPDPGISSQVQEGNYTL